MSRLPRKILAIALLYAAYGAIQVTITAIEAFKNVASNASAYALVYSSLGVASSAIFLLAGVALLQSRPWSRWLFFATAVLPTAVLIWLIPAFVRLLQHISSSPNTGSVSQNAESFLSGFGQVDTSPQNTCSLTVI